MERLTYMAIYECRDCHEINTAPRRFKLHFGEFCRCPLCGTFRVVRLKKRDGIDPMHGGFLHLLERMAGGHLYHCRYCRVQFYDRRRLAPESGPEGGAPPHVEATVR
jgi:predicted SprT family Zn-dependent metalloprotease